MLSFNPGSNMFGTGNGAPKNQFIQQTPFSMNNVNNQPYLQQPQSPEVIEQNLVMNPDGTSHLEREINGVRYSFGGNDGSNGQIQYRLNGCENDQLQTFIDQSGNMHTENIFGNMRTKLPGSGSGYVPGSDPNGKNPSDAQWLF